MSTSDEHDHRRFFGRRKGHQLKRRQAGLMDTLLPQLALDLAAPGPQQPAALFPSAPGIENLWLEIGFGGGEHLAAHAAARAATGFIGCEPFLNGMAKAVARVVSVLWFQAIIPIRGRRFATGNAASCRTTASRKSRAS